MRQVKFRGKRIDNGEWVYGFLVGSVNPHKTETEYDSWFIHTGVNVSSFLRVDPATVGQFTGLTDKNGKEVFEGDLIQTKFGAYPVFYNDKTAAFAINQPVSNTYDAQSGYDVAFYLHNFYDKEIIGNIHENK